ncbi:MAG: hypothetical protein CW338_00180 [Clostridiales bacterium]|nr:hypothetical protein [Clostridiales bacterium]
MKNAVRIFALFLVLALTAVPAAFAEDEGWKNARDVLNDITIGYNYGNQLDSCDFNTGFINAGPGTETSWGNPRISREMIDLVKSSGFNIIRLPVTWYNHMDENHVIDPAWMDRVQEVVDMIVDEDTYCVLNVQHDTGSNGWLRADDRDLEEKTAIFVQIWQQICERFGGYGDHLIFEGFNEMLDGRGEWNHPAARAMEIINLYNQIFVDTVRASGGNNARRVLLVNTYAAGGGSSVVKAFVMPEDILPDAIIMGAHIYQPYQFTTASSPAAKTWDKNSINTYLNSMKKYGLDLGYPVIIGEFGAEDKNNLPERIAWACYYVSKCNELGLKCLWWDNGALFRLFDRRTRTVAEPELLEALTVTAAGGEYVFDRAAYEQQHVSDNLCDVTDNWTVWIDTYNGGQGLVDYLPSGISIDVTAPGKDAWHVQGTYRNITLEEGVTYEVTFTVECTAGITFPVYLQKNYGDYTVYGGLDAVTVAAGEKQTFTFTYTMTGATDKNVALVFNTGAQKDAVPFTVTLTDLVMKKAAE